MIFFILLNIFYAPISILNFNGLVYFIVYVYTIGNTKLCLINCPFFISSRGLGMAMSMSSDIVVKDKVAQIMYGCSVVYSQSRTELVLCQS